MPQVTVYIREQDIDKWKALKKKSEYIHQMLNPMNKVDFEDSIWVYLKHNPKFLKELLREYSSPPDSIVGKKNLEPRITHQERKPTKDAISLGQNPNYCKHNAAPELCKFAKPGKPCK